MRTTTILGLGVLLLGGCGFRKSHLTSYYGQSYDSAFAAQRERRDKAPALATTGLDSQEAAIVSDTYRASLAPKGGSAKEEPLILVSPGSERQPGMRPAPSVPRD